MTKLRLTGLVFAVLGFMDAIYLMVIKFANRPDLCIKGVGDCWSVNTSPYSEVYGIPISVFGATAYLVLIFLLAMESKPTFWQPYTRYLVFAITLAGVIYSAYLTYLEIAVINAICPFCVVSAILMLGLLLLSVIGLRSNQKN